MVVLAESEHVIQPVDHVTQPVDHVTAAPLAIGRTYSVADLSRTPDAALHLCWEWREGRLFAYELILKFLIKNHWLYTFGASSMAQLNTSRTGGSFDDGLLSK